MKRSSFIVMLCFVIFTTEHISGQVDKGKFLVGASSDFNAFFNNTRQETTVNGNTTEEDGPKSTQFGFTPSVGYFIVNGLAGGLFMNLDFRNSEREEVLEDGSTETLNSKSTSFSMGPFVRYYIDMEKVKPFAHLQVGFGSSNLKYDMIEYDYSDPFNPKYVVKEHEYKSNLSNWSIGAGTAIFVGNNVSVDIMLGYKSNTARHSAEDSGDENKSTTGSFGLDVGFSIIIP